MRLTRDSAALERSAAPPTPRAGPSRRRAMHTKTHRALLILATILAALAFASAAEAAKVDFDNDDGRVELSKRGSSHRRTDKFAARRSFNPEEKCNGKTMYYIPLLRMSDHEEIGVCDSSCSELADAPLNKSTSQLTADVRAEKAHHYEEQRRRKKRRAEILPGDVGSRANLLSEQYLYSCNMSKTLPEAGVPPDQVDNFPFHMRTCYATAAAAIENANANGSNNNHDDVTQKRYELLAQMQFEQACTQARGTFIHPYYKTW